MDGWTVFLVTITVLILLWILARITRRKREYGENLENSQQLAEQLRYLNSRPLVAEIDTENTTSVSSKPKQSRHKKET